MAVDSQEKRMSAGNHLPWMRAKFPVGSTDEQSRINSGHAYGGNALSPGAGRIMGSAAGHGGLAGPGGIAGQGGGLAG